MANNTNVTTIVEGSYHWYKHENICNTPYTECTAVSDGFICVIWASLIGETSEAQSLRPTDFAVLGDVAVTVVGSLREVTTDINMRTIECWLHYVIIILCSVIIHLFLLLVLYVNIIRETDSLISWSITEDKSGLRVPSPTFWCTNLTIYIYTSLFPEYH